ncbi:MAG: glycosyltransferase family 39 protein [Chthoniobacterales bacterium]
MTALSGSEESRGKVERWARFTPVAIVCYCAVVLAARLLLSSNLEPDESLFVGHLDWSLGYGRSQPPLYQWLVILFVRGLHFWPAIAILKYLCLTATGLFVYDTTRRASGSRAAGALAVLSLAFVHQIIWLSQLTLSHSVLALAAAAATLHALVCLLEGGSARRFLWLAVALAVGLLSKYNFAVYLLSLGAAAVTIREFRVALGRPWLALTIGLVLAAVAPHGWWAWHHPGETMARMETLRVQTVVFGKRIPLGGFEGFFSLLWGVLSSIVPMIAIRALAAWRLPAVPSPPVSSKAEAMRKLCLRAMLIALALSALALLPAGVKNVPERYLTVLLIPFPIWFALAFPIDRQPLAALLYARFAAATAILCALALTAQTLFGTTAYALPTTAVARDLREFAQPPFAIAGTGSELPANLVTRLPGTSVFDPAQPAERVLAIWNAAESRLPALIAAQFAERYQPVSPGRLIEQPYAYFSGKQARFYAQMWKIVSAADLRLLRSIPRILNVSLRATLPTEGAVLTGGFVVTGSLPRPVLIRALGPSLQSDGIPMRGALQNPSLLLFQGDNRKPVGGNDNWKTNESAIRATGLQPEHNAEAAIATTLDPSAYSIVVHAQKGGTGVAVADVHDLGVSSVSTLSSFSCRGFVETGDRAMFARFTLGPENSGRTSVVIRGLGPSLREVVPEALRDPVLELYDSSGTRVETNDDWQQSTGVAALQNAHLSPLTPSEAAIFAADLAPGDYTAVLRGKAEETGVGSLEIYALP